MIKLLITEACLDIIKNEWNMNIFIATQIFVLCLPFEAIEYFMFDNIELMLYDSLDQ